MNWHVHSIAAAAALASVAIIATAGPSSSGVGIEVGRAGSQPSQAGPTQNFTGRVRIDSSFERRERSHIATALVTFEPSARTAWHTHPLEQTLIVTSGVGWVQEWEKPARSIAPGDTVWIAPGVKHWHGATSTTAMSHIAITEGSNGKLVEWMEKVSDAEYGGPSP